MNEICRSLARARGKPAAAFRQLLLVLLLAGLPAFAAAAGPDRSEISLSGMTEATLGVSQLTADGIACGLDLAQIGEATHHILADAGLGLHDAADDRITVSAISARVGTDQCATAVMLGAYAKESFFSRAAGWVQSGYVVMWQRSAMVATPIGEHASRVLDATRRVAREMLADWQAQNRTPMAANPDNRNLSAGNAAIPIKRTP